MRGVNDKNPFAGFLSLTGGVVNFVFLWWHVSVVFQWSGFPAEQFRSTPVMLRSQIMADVVTTTTGGFSAKIFGQQYTSLLGLARKCSYFALFFSMRWFLLELELFKSSDSFPLVPPRRSIISNLKNSDEAHYLFSRFNTLAKENF